MTLNLQFNSIKFIRNQVFVKSKEYKKKQKNSAQVFDVHKKINKRRMGDEPIMNCISQYENKLEKSATFVSIKRNTSH